ncbi:MAG: replication initiator protein [Microvirus sp.]|nr:MAG: replication initiator protein [Microvirus sp.]
MKCADPVLCYTDQKGKRIFRHFSHSSEIYKAHLHQQVFSCGRCLPCRKAKAQQLAARCCLHASLYKDNCFLTLTYDEKKEGYHNEFHYADVQNFKKRLRKYVSGKLKRRIEVFNVHEYGKNGKKHWHLIVFNWRPDDQTLFTTSGGHSLYTSKLLEKLWSKGFSTIGDVSEGSALYQAQYMEKDFKHDNQTSKRKSHSKHSGLGRPYFEKHYKQLLTLGYVPFGGRKIAIPRYFEKIADKHYSYFYDQSRFHDTSFRKAVHRPFKKDQANKEIADLYLEYKTVRQKHIESLEEEWKSLITEHLTAQNEPDFIKSASNKLYDLKNRQDQEKF